MSEPGTDSKAAATLERKGHLAFSWDDLDKIELPSGITTQMYRIGSQDDAPTVFKVFYPPGCTIEAHTHECDYTEIILEGTQRVVLRIEDTVLLSLAPTGRAFCSCLPIIDGPP